MREKIEDGSFGLLAPEPLGGGGEGPDLHYFLLGDDAFVLMPWMECLWNLSELVQSTTGHHGAKTKGCQRHCVYMYGVAQQ